MTEAEWLACTDLFELLKQVKGEGSRRKAPCITSERKLRLFACACCRRIWPLLIDQRSREAVDFGERLADGRVTYREWKGARRWASNAISDIWNAHWDGNRESVDVPSIPAATAALMAVAEGDTQFDDETPYLPDAEDAAANCARAVGFASGPAAEEAEAAAQRALFHEIMSNPFRPVHLDRPSLPDEVILLARTIYLERQFDRMPELAAYLERGGCIDQEILNHCSGPGPHVRGCWALDFVLGKA